MPMRSIPISVFILTKNEEDNLEDCLRSLAGWCDDIHIVDSYSTDRTLEIAGSYTQNIHEHVFEGHTAQRTWALRNLPLKYEWVFALDADHRVTPELEAELRTVFSQKLGDVNGFYVKRRQIFRGRWIRFGGYYPKYMLKLFRHSGAFLDDNEFDYRFYVPGRTATLKHDIIEANLKEWRISFFIDKHNKFASELAVEELGRRAGTMKYLVKPQLFGNHDQRTLWLKLRWMRLPLYVRPFLLLAYRVVLRLGFLDGKEGLLFHFLQSFWFRLLVDVRIEELKAAGGRR